MRRKVIDKTEQDQKRESVCLLESITCHDCGQAVDLVVTRDQVVGPNEFICLDCKVKRLRDRVEEKIDALMVAAREARAALAQGSMF